MIRRWILKHLGVLGEINRAEYNIINRIGELHISGSCMDDITEIIMDELSNVRRTKS